MPLTKAASEGGRAASGSVPPAAAAAAASAANVRDAGTASIRTTPDDGVLACTGTVTVPMSRVPLTLLSVVPARSTASHGRPGMEYRTDVVRAGAVVVAAVVSLVIVIVGSPLMRSGPAGPNWCINGREIRSAFRGCMHANPIGVHAPPRERPSLATMGSGPESRQPVVIRPGAALTKTRKEMAMWISSGAPAPASSNLRPSQMAAPCQNSAAWHVLCSIAPGSAPPSPLMRRGWCCGSRSVCCRSWSMTCRRSDIVGGSGGRRRTRSPSRRRCSCTRRCHDRRSAGTRCCSTVSAC